ncbi:MAG: hypothetical protein GX612_02140 [Bacteroidales bacterium]|nr:hypothetical protein [Bacteroidales bacterium]
MITLSDIWDKFGEFWQWLRSGVVAIKMAICKLPALIAAPVVAAFAGLKLAYNKAIDFIDQTFLEMQTTLETLSEGVKEGSSSAGLLQFIEVANAVFPISELISIILILLGLWGLCLVIRLALRFYHLIMEVIPG